jgi:hypothetical protein
VHQYLTHQLHNLSPSTFCQVLSIHKLGEQWGCWQIPAGQGLPPTKAPPLLTSAVS